MRAYVRFMRRHPPRHLPERAAACLTCACEDRRNATARILLRRTCSLSVAGVLAAILIADTSEHVDIVSLARTAIEQQREVCREQGPFMSQRCGEHGQAALQKK